MRRVGPYEVLKSLGKGGMGEVFLVRDPAVGRLSALKLIRPGRSENALARFTREAHALAKVRHPGVVSIHDVGQVPEGHYLVMDYVEGQVLSEAIPLSPQAAARVAAGLADALGAIHAVGLLHRDLKPENVILRADGEPVLLDFGLVTAEGSASEEVLTKTGQVMGTPYAMSPEQAAGLKQLSPATDVWGLGVVLYMMLSGVPPFGGQNLVEVLLAIGKETPRWPSAPRPLLSILRRCLKKRPRERYGDAQVLADDLRRFLSGKTPTGGARARLHGSLVAGPLVLALGFGLGALLTRAPVVPPPGDPPPDSRAGPLAPPKGADAVTLADVDGARGDERQRLACEWLRSHSAHGEARRLHGWVLRRGLPPSVAAGDLPERMAMRPFVSHGQLLVAGSKLYRWGGEGAEAGLDLGGGTVYALADGPGGARVVSLFLGRQGGRLELERGGELRGVQGLGRQPITALASRGDRLVTGDAFGVVRVHSWARLLSGDDAPEYELPKLDSAVVDLELSEDGGVLLVTSGQDVSLNPGDGRPENRFTVWDLSRARMPRKAWTQELQGQGGHIAISPDGGLAAVSLFWVNELHVYDLIERRLAHRLVGETPVQQQTIMGGYIAGGHRAHTSGISGVTFLPTGLLASVSGSERGGELRLWDPVEGAELAKALDLPRALLGVVHHEGRLYSASVAPGKGGKLVSWELYGP